MAKAKKNTLSDEDLSRLCAAMRAGRQTLEFFRTERREAVRQYVGRHWSENGAEAPVPLNLIARYCQVVQRSLVAKAPRVMLSTFDRKAKPAVAAMEQWANREIERTGLAETIRRVVLDGLFSVGIAKVALATPADAASVGWNLGAGTPFVERVDLDDFVFDVHARDFTEASFVGHRYRAPLSSVADSDLYKRAARKKLTASDDPEFNAEGDERIHALGRGYEGSQDEFEEHVDLWEVYLPRRRLVVTLRADEGGVPCEDDEPLRVQEWLGPDAGPYHFLCYMPVPGNAMPKGPVMDLIDLHEETNKALRKLMRQAARSKDLTTYRRANDADAARVREASDGEMVGVDSPESITPVTTGGPNQALFAAFVAFKDLFNSAAGNLELLGGQAPQSKTATQDRLLNENASAGVADLQEMTVAFVSRVLKALCWYWWNDPFRVMRVEHAVGGATGASITRRVGPRDRRQTRFADLDVRVDPYSMQASTPQQRAAQLNQVVMQLVAPLLPLLQQQGIALDLNALLDKLAKYMDMPDLQEIVTYQEPPQVEGGRPSGGEAPGMPASTTRNYVRESTSGRTDQGNDKTLINSLLGVDSGGARDRGRPMQVGA